MNFLAHAYLSGDNTKLLIGNFIGDFVKGRDYEQFESEIAKGVLLHRAIDEFTDNHPIVGESKDRLRKKYRHYSGVVVDVFYDHFLAKNWKKYHEKPLLKYTEAIYNILDDHGEILPKQMKFVLGYMKRDNWLYNYSKVKGINRALTGMAKRTKFDSKMEEAVIDLRANYSLFEEEFHNYLPEAEQFVKNWLEKNN